MRYGFIVIALFFLFAPQVDAATKYVRPSSGEYGLEDGSSYANAYDGFADVAWGAGGVSSTTADTLKICGSFNSSDFDGGGLAMLSVDQASTTMDGDCSDQGDLPRAILTGDGLRDHGLYCADNTTCPGQTWKNIFVQDFDSRGFYIRSSLSTTNFVGFTGHNLSCEDIIYGDSAASPQCVAGFGAVARLTNITSLRTTDDSIHWEGDDFYLENADLRYPGYATTSNLGDCVQVANQADNATVRNLYCDHSNNATKQCVIYTLGVGDDNAEMSDIYCKFPRTGNALYQNKPLYSDVPGTLFLRNYVDGGHYGIYMLGANSTAVGNVVANQELRGIDAVSTVSSGVAKIYNNTVYNANSCFVFNGGASVTVEAYNNLALGCTTGYNKGGSASLVSRNNAGFNNTTEVNGLSAITYSGVNPRLLGETSPNNLNDYRPTASTTLTNGGVYIGNYTDITGKPFEYTPSIGAFQFGARDFIRNRIAR